MPPSSNSSVPSGLDRADGSLFGTPSLPGQIMINHNGITGGTAQFLEEYSDSPEMEFGEQDTIVHRFHCDTNTKNWVIITHKRGYIMVDSHNNLSKILTVKVSPIQKTGALTWNIVITSEGLYNNITVDSLSNIFSNPPDEFSIDPIELNPALEKHPRYKDLTYKQRWLVRNAAVSDNQEYEGVYVTTISQISGSGGNSLQQQEAQELLYKKHKGEDSFYLSGYRVTWSSYFWQPQVLNPGGYIEDPVLTGNLPVGFWSNNQTANGINIFSAAGSLNANLFPTSPTGASYGISWLRQMDQISYQRTWFKLTRTWIGGNLGHWDNQIYNRQLQPYQTSEDDGAIS